MFLVRLTLEPAFCTKVLVFSELHPKPPSLLSTSVKPQPQIQTLRNLSIFFFSI
jgi:hypothetical protein